MGTNPVMLHLMQVRIDFRSRRGVRAAKVMARLKSKGIGSQVHYIPVHRQPYWRARYGMVNLPSASTPSTPGLLSASTYSPPRMRDDDPDRVAAALSEALAP